MRKSLWQLKAELFTEQWLPPRVRVVSVVAAVVAVVVGFGAAFGLAAHSAGGESASRRTLLVRSSPPGASVTLDDERLEGQTPLIIDADLDDGAHGLKLALAAGAPAQRKIVLGAEDRFVIVNESLQTAGAVRVETRPGGARVLLDGRDVGVGPLRLDVVSTDKSHVVEARKANHRTATATIPVDRPAEHIVLLTLEPERPPGRIVVQSALPALISLDGVPWGTTSSQERECPPGKHELVLRVAELGLEERATVDIPERGLARYFVSFD